MKLVFACMGKEHDPPLAGAIGDYSTRVARYYPLEWELIPGMKPGTKTAPDEWRRQESALALARIRPEDQLVLLDERGKLLSSPELAGIIDRSALRSDKRLVFLVGGAFGVDDSVRARAGLCWSLSPLVFPHMIVRLILAEQVYRACTILRNEKYHHG